jgi:uncharacterized membrane protein YgdD (TMEM256/DUF423 family)
VPQRALVLAAAVLGFLGVALGAFGAHALKLEGKPLEWWHTGSQYHLVHALAALLAAILGAPRAGWLFVAGTAIFSGSLYAMALTDVRVLGAITPLGGLCYLVGWAMLAVAAGRKAA